MNKKMFFAAATLVAALSTGHLYAQIGQASGDYMITRPTNDNGSAGASVTPSPAKDAAASTISLRAIKDFRYRFANVSEEHWSRINKGYCVFFKKEGFSTRAYYDSRGFWTGSLKYCDETQLPHVIRDVVKRTYYDLSITGVIIASVPEHTAYIVNLEDKDNLKVVRVTDDTDMEVLHEFTKTH